MKRDRGGEIDRQIIKERDRWKERGRDRESEQDMQCSKHVKLL